ncbi:facilitated trehalose transporter Tret1-like isoform X1 [Diorhabda carinulata]|uniref:facilitated trehalose transporter Tret1-like isoform X1 n=1 Tax=Diorhabda carinulata TaxID=1163345 RepID=UPI0025A07E3C|nr:facilitated trehalose transporter Tret1-like isoform X1 [Diorhabda carinulata]
MENSSLQEVNYVPSDGAENIIKLSPSNVRKKSDTIFLRFVILSAVLLQLEGSAFWIWPSPAIVKMKSEDLDSNPLGRVITTTEITLLVGIPGYVSLIGGAILPKISDILGRNRSLHLLGLAMLLCAIGLAYSNNIYLIIIFLTLFQTVSAGIWGILPVYITEICEDHNRAKYGCVMSIFSPVGQLYGYVTGSYFSLRSFTFILATPLFVFLLCFLFAPESPVYSLSRGRKEECIKTLKKLRNNKTDIELQTDLYHINKSLIEKEEAQQTSKINIVQLFTMKEGRIGLILAALPILAQSFSGVPVMMPLLAPIFNDLGSDLSGNTISIIIGTVKVLTFSLTSLIVEKTGRRLMLICSSVGAGVMVSLVGISFYLKTTKSAVADQLEYVTLAGIILYVLLYSIGLGPIPMAVMSELFSPELRSSALSFLSITTNLALTGYSSIFPLLAECIGTYSCFWIFGVTCFIQALIFIAVFPETKGKSIVEIQDMLRNYKVFK